MNDTITSNRIISGVDSKEMYPPEPDDVDISEGVELPYKNRDDYLEKEKSNIKIYLHGNMYINPNYSSKLLFVFIKTGYHYLRRVFLLNIKTDRIRSITMLSECISYANDSGCLYVDLKLVGEGVLSLEGGVCGSKGSPDYYQRIECFPEFYYDDDGYLHIAKLHKYFCN